MANEGYHEPVEKLSAETMDMHRAIVSLMEELEAVDWYNQRVDACNDRELKAILFHYVLASLLTHGSQTPAQTDLETEVIGFT